MAKRISMVSLISAAAISVAAPTAAVLAASAATTTSWVYYDGAFDWAGDYSYSAYADYKDTSGEPRSGVHDIKVSVTSAWGGWAPVPRNGDFDAQPYNSLTVALKPTRANQKWQIYVQNKNGASLASSCTRDVAEYGPAPEAGVWATYTIPLSALCVSGDTAVGKFVIEDRTGLSDNTWYVDNIGFESTKTVLPPPPVKDPPPPPVKSPPPTPPPVVSSPPPVKSPPPPVTTPPPPPASGTSWVYYDGNFDWPGDYSFAATINYNDTGGGPLSGAKDVEVKTTPWGGWLPYAKNWDFNSAPYSKLTFALKPTVDNQKWHVYFVKVGDVPVGIYVDPSKYGPAPQAGKWATYTIPLSDLGVKGLPIYKFCIQDQTGLSENTWYVDNVGFAP
jgi:hypothetical protein